MSVRIAGELVEQARDQERRRCIRILARHIRGQDSGYESDGANLVNFRLAMQRALSEMQAAKRQKA